MNEQQRFLQDELTDKDIEKMCIAVREFDDTELSAEHKYHNIQKHVSTSSAIYCNVLWAEKQRRLNKNE